MSNEISRLMKQKTDAQLRLAMSEQRRSTTENSDGTIQIIDPTVYTKPIAQGRNVVITTSGNSQVINAVMNLLQGNNIRISEPDGNGAVTITATIGGKGIDMTGLQDGFVLAYELATDKFRMTAIPVPYELPKATENALGGIKAKARTAQTSEVVIDVDTGILYSSTSSEGSGSFDYGSITDAADVFYDYGGLS